MSKAATRLLWAIREFNAYHGREQDHAELVGQLQGYHDQVEKAFFPNGDKDSPGLRAAQSAASGEQAPAPYRPPREEQKDQPKTYADARAAAVEQLAAALGDTGGGNKTA